MQELELNGILLSENFAWGGAGSRDYYSIAVTELALSAMFGSDSDLRMQMGVKYGTLLEIVITFYLVWVPECGTQTSYDLFFSCFSKVCEN